MAAASEQSQPRGGSSARSSKGPLDLGTEALPMARGEKARRVSYRGTLVKHWRADVEHQTSIFSFGSRMLNLGTSSTNDRGVAAEQENPARRRPGRDLSRRSPVEAGAMQCGTVERDGTDQSSGI